MQKLIIKFISFSIVVISILFVTSRVIQHHDEIAFNKSLKLPNKRMILVLGDSHTACGIDDNECSEFVNLSEGAESYYYNFLKLKKIIEANQNELDNISCIVLSYHVFSCSNNRDSVFIGDMASHFFDAYKMYHQDYDDSPYNLGLYIDKVENIKQVLIAKLNLYNKFDLNNLILGKTRATANELMGGLLTISDEFIDDHEKNAPIHIGAPDQFETKFKCSRQPFILEKIAKLASDNNIPMVLVNVPCHHLYTEHIYDKLDQFNDSIAHALKIKYNTLCLDFMKLPYPDSLYANSDHINKRGAAVFTPMLRDTLISLGLY